MDAADGDASVSSRRTRVYPDDFLDASRRSSVEKLVVVKPRTLLPLAMTSCDCAVTFDVMLIMQILHTRAISVDV